MTLLGGPFGHYWWYVKPTLGNKLRYQVHGAMISSQFYKDGSNVRAQTYPRVKKRKTRNKFSWPRPKIFHERMLKLMLSPSAAALGYAQNTNRQVLATFFLPLPHKFYPRSHSTAIFYWKYIIANIWNNLPNEQSYLILITIINPDKNIVTTCKNRIYDSMHFHFFIWFDIHIILYWMHL